jgi:Ca-activated chloride channel homolog
MIPRRPHGHARRVPALSPKFLVFPLLAALACTQPEPVRSARPVASTGGVPATASPPAASPTARAAEANGAAAKPQELEAAQPGASPAPKKTPTGHRRKAAQAGPAGGGALGLSGVGRGAFRSHSGRAAPYRLLPSAPPAAGLVDPEFDTEAYAPLTENAFLAVKEHPLSTFSSDVDTASYSNARRFLGDGRLPPRDSIRIEEWINYFSYDYAPPTGDAPVAIHTEVSACPWNSAHRLVRVGLKTRPVEQAAVPARNLVFLLDVSGSMQQPDKLPLLKTGLGMLARTLRANDRVAIVVYAGASGLVLPSTPGDKQGDVLAALGALEAGGSTNGADGIRLAYAVAKEHFLPGGINRVILATDGDFNVGTTSLGELETLIEEKRKTGVFLTVLGFGDGNLKDSTMELLADKGNGNYAYVDSALEARKVLVREAGATLVTVAKDVKLQVEFNLARVASYRLVGYENRLLAKEDFNDDRKDAGDMGAGHSVTALYEVVPIGAVMPASQAPAVSALRYQTEGKPTPAAELSELMTVSVRYKLPNASQSAKLVASVADRATPFERASGDHRFAVAVAEFAQVLRGTPGVGKTSLASAESMARASLGPDPHGTRRELLALIQRAQSLSAH